MPLTIISIMHEADFSLLSKQLRHVEETQERPVAGVMYSVTQSIPQSPWESIVMDVVRFWFPSLAVHKNYLGSLKNMVAWVPPLWFLI